MKGFFAIAAFAFVLILATSMAAPAEDSEPPKCKTFCTMEFNAVCGYDGTCYKQYPNPCSYEAAKCTRKSNLETVDMSLCDLADKNNHPNYKICSE